MKDSLALPLILRDKVQKTGSAIFRVTGGSMIPAIWPYSRVRVKRVDFGSLSTGDVICYITKSGMHCHRIIAIVSDLCFTLGDAYSCVRPELVRADNLIGRVEGVGIGTYWIHYSSPGFGFLSKISPKTGKPVRKTIHHALFLPVLGLFARRIIAKIKNTD